MPIVSAKNKNLMTVKTIATRNKINVTNHNTVTRKSALANSTKRRSTKYTNHSLFINKTLKYGRSRKNSVKRIKIKNRTNCLLLLMSFYLRKHAKTPINNTSHNKHEAHEFTVEKICLSPILYVQLPS